MRDFLRDGQQDGGAGGFLQVQAPEHRRKGLAAAALSRHYHTMKALGATHMTGGADPFYEKIGYGNGSHWTIWKRDGDGREQ